MEYIGRDANQGLDRRHIERTGQRHARRDPATVMRFVVLRHVETVAGIQRERGILDQRGRGQVAPFESQCIEKRFEGRAGLAQGGDAIDFGCT